MAHKVKEEPNDNSSLSPQYNWNYDMSDYNDNSENDDMSTSSVDSSDEDSITAFGRNNTELSDASKKSSKKVGNNSRKTISKNRKHHHNANEKQRRLQLKSCYEAVKEVVKENIHPSDLPKDLHNNVALKLIIGLLDSKNGTESNPDYNLRIEKREQTFRKAEKSKRHR